MVHSLGIQCPQFGHALPLVWALNARSVGNRLNSPIKKVKLGEKEFKLRVEDALLEVRIIRQRVSINKLSVYLIQMPK